MGQGFVVTTTTGNNLMVTSYHVLPSRKVIMDMWVASANNIRGKNEAFAGNNNCLAPRLEQWLCGL
jgi:hypothetical protein